MSKKFFYLTKVSLLKKIKTKSFVITNIIILILLLALTNVDNIIKFFGGNFSKTNNIMIVDNTYNINNLFEDNLKNNILTTFDYKVTKYSNEKEARNNVKKDEDILIIVNDDEENVLDVTLVTYSYISSNVYTSIENSINNVKKELSLSKLNISKEELSKVTTNITLKREFIKDDLDEKEERNNMILSAVFPIIILPFFLFTISVIQMIGAEINEEKSTRSMEIIISNVSAKVHFFSKILAANAFIIIQTMLIGLYSFVGVMIRSTSFDMESVSKSLDFGVSLDFSIIAKLLDAIPITVVLMIITLLGYSLLAGILASVTTNMEDFQHMQTPIILLTLTSFYLSISSIIFEGSTFIKIMSYFPFISSILSPCLYITNVIELKDVIISIVLMLITIILLIKYGIRVYKQGILNYSSSNLWKKIFKSIKK